MPALHELPHQDDEGTLRAVIEAPEGARVRIDQRGARGRARNDRLVTIPTGLSRWGRIRSVTDLSREMRDDVEKFFLDSTFFTDKDVRSRGFAGPSAARRAVERAARAFQDER